MERGGRLAFVDVVRTLSIMSVVWLHIEMADLAAGLDGRGLTYVYLSSIMRFGLGCFFIISGWLMRNKIELYGWGYLWQRFKSLIYPTLFVALLTTIYTLLAGTHDKGFYTLQNLLYDAFMHSQLWFILNLWIAIAVFTFFRRIYTSVYFGVFLFVLVQVITWITVYNVDTARPHTETFAGFIFYFWLGNYLGRNNMQVKIASVPWVYLLVALAVVLAGSHYGSQYLVEHDLYLSSLKWGFQGYTFVAFAILTKIFSRTSGVPIRLFHNEAMGIFFYHFLIVRVLRYAVTKSGLRLPENYQWFTGPLLHVVLFLLVFSVTLVAVRWMNCNKLGFLRPDDRVAKRVAIYTARPVRAVSHLINYRRNVVS